MIEIRRFPLMVPLLLLTALVLVVLTPALPANAAPAASAPGTVNIFNQVPTFNMYDPVTHRPETEVPADDIQVDNTTWQHKLTAAEQASIGADLTMRITLTAMCDVYDRIGTVAYAPAPIGGTPDPANDQIEISRIITPFQTLETRPNQQSYSVPAARFAQALADTTQDIWMIVSFDGLPVTDGYCASATPYQKTLNRLVSLDMVSTEPLAHSSTYSLQRVDRNRTVTASPHETSFTVPVALQNAQLLLTTAGHGSDLGGEEYEHRVHNVLLDGVEVATFDPAAECSAYAGSSPAGNPGIFADNLGRNPRNWCPGAALPAQVIALDQLSAGQHTLKIEFVGSRFVTWSFYDVSQTIVSS